MTNLNIDNIRQVTTSENSLQELPSFDKNTNGGSGSDWLLVAILLLAIFWPEPGKRKKHNKSDDKED